MSFSVTVMKEMLVVAKIAIFAKWEVDEGFIANAAHEMRERALSGQLASSNCLAMDGANE